MLDRDIRFALKAFLRAAEPGIALYEEFSLLRGEGRADCATVNGALQGYEIKSDSDSLARLPSQIKKYEAIFDYCTVVLVHRHLNSARKIVPRSWGILLAEECGRTVSIRSVRCARRLHRNDYPSLIRLLWKPEAIKICRNAGVKIRANTPVRSVWALLESMPRQMIVAAIRESLKLRAL